jgi:hypothetical protein
MFHQKENFGIEIDFLFETDEEVKLKNFFKEVDEIGNTKYQVFELDNESCVSIEMKTVNLKIPQKKLLRCTNMNQIFCLKILSVIRMKLQI